MKATLELSWCTKGNSQMDERSMHPAPLQDDEGAVHTTTLSVRDPPYNMSIEGTCNMNAHEDSVPEAPIPNFSMSPYSSGAPPTILWTAQLKG